MCPTPAISFSHLSRSPLSKFHHHREFLMFDCLYCGNSQEPTNASLEHAIPQFLGGDSAPDRFQLKNVCAKCNNRLGLFVDASYAKAWFTTNALANSAHALCRSETDPGLPFTYLGHAKIEGLSVPSGCIAEHWIGPSGETTIWVRSHDARMDTYAGGNPIAAKSEPSTVYFVPTVARGPLLTIALNSLERMFKKKKARRILCAVACDENGVEITESAPGFDLPNEDEKASVAAILQQVASQKMVAQVGVNANFDHRFICKMALGVGYALFGEQFLQEPTTAEFRRGLWPRKDEADASVRGVSTLAAPNSSLAPLTHYPGAVVLLVIRAGAAYSLTLTVDPTLSFTVELGQASALAGNFTSGDDGYALVLVPYLEVAIELPFSDLLAHRQGTKAHPDLRKIDQRACDAKVFWTQIHASSP